MSTALLTENGKPSKAEANIQVAIQQRRIAPEQAEQWRDLYERDGYEPVTRKLVAQKPGRVSAGRSYSEAAWDQFAKACWITPPSSGYHRSVV